MESDIGRILRKRKLRFREALLLVGELKAVVKAALGPWQVCVWTLWILWQSWALLSLLSSQQEVVLRKSYCWSVLAWHLARNNTVRLLPPVGSSLESWLPVFGLALFSPPLKCSQSRAPHSPGEILSQACLRVGDRGKASSRWRWNSDFFSSCWMWKHPTENDCKMHFLLRQASQVFPPGPPDAWPSSPHDSAILSGDRKRRWSSPPARDGPQCCRWAGHICLGESPRPSCEEGRCGLRGWPLPEAAVGDGPRRPWRSRPRFSGSWFLPRPLRATFYSWLKLKSHVTQSRLESPSSSI